VLVSVRKNSVAVLTDGKPLLSWKGDFTRAGNSGDGGPTPSAPYIGNWESVYEVSQILLYPLTGKGKPVAHVR